MRTHCVLGRVLLALAVWARASALSSALDPAHRRRILQESMDACPQGSDGVIVTLEASRSPSNATRTHGDAKRHVDNFAARLASRPWGRRLQSDQSSVHALYATVLEGVAAVLDDNALDEVLHDPEVKRVEANCLISLDDPEDEETGDQRGVAGVKMRTSNVGSSEVQLGAPWNLDRIDSRSGRDGEYDFGSSQARGAGTVIYVLDTGVRIDHEDFQGRALTGHSVGCQAADSCSEGYVYQGVIDDASSTCSSHGTHCASTAAGRRWGVA